MKPLKLINFDELQDGMLIELSFKQRWENEETRELYIVVGDLNLTEQWEVFQSFDCSFQHPGDFFRFLVACGRLERLEPTKLTATYDYFDEKPFTIEEVQLEEQNDGNALSEV